MPFVDVSMKALISFPFGLEASNFVVDTCGSGAHSRGHYQATLWWMLVSLTIY